MILAGRSSPERSVAAAQRQSRATLGGERGCTAAIHPGAPVPPRGPGPHSAFKIHRLCRRKIANVCKISTALVQILDNKKSWFNKMHLAFPWVSRPKKKKNLARIKYRANSRIRWKWWVSDQQVGLETILWGWHFPVNHWNDTLPWCHVQKLKKAIVYQQNRKKAFTIFYLL